MNGASADVTEIPGSVAPRMIVRKQRDNAAVNKEPARLCVLYKEIKGAARKVLFQLPAECKCTLRLCG